VQSCNFTNPDQITIYKGTLGQYNNNTPNNSTLTDKSVVLLGANSASGYGSYTLGSTFAGGATIDPGQVNYLNTTKYKVQVTNSGQRGASQSQTINVKLYSTSTISPRFVLVAPTESSPASQTRIYSVINGISTGVVVNDGDFLSSIGFKSTPGGVTGANYTWMAWLVPESYSNGTWTNMIVTPGTVGDFTQNPALLSTSLTSTSPAPIIPGYNFQRAVSFSTTGYTVAPNEMESTGNFSISSTESFAMFFVMQKGKSPNGNEDYIIGYGASGYYAGQGIWYPSANTTAHIGWTAGTGTATDRTLGNAPAGILGIDNPNSTTARINWFTNGTGPNLSSTTTNANGTLTYPLRLGSTRFDNNGERGFNGSIQEVIIVKKTGGSGSYMAPTDVQQINSYLAIKYGITMAGVPKYVNSAGIAVWDSLVNKGYNNNIFGLARDDASGLYVKQSQSVNNKLMTLYVGNSPSPSFPGLNRDNTGTLDNMQYLMLGASDARIILGDNTQVGGVYEGNDTLQSSTGFNIGSAVFKAQLNGTDTMMVDLTSPSLDFTYLLVSKDATFDPASTKIYPVNGNGFVYLPIETTHPYLKFIGFSPGPGGVTKGLKLWLRGDAAVDITSITSSDARYTNYPGVVGDANPFVDANNIPAVSGWNDLVRGISYTYDAGETTAAHRIPVMKSYSPEMNYYPGVRFWGGGQSTGTGAYGAFLANQTGNIFPTNALYPHTALFVTNNDFVSASWIYPMMFGSATGTTADANYYGPGYGVQKNNTDLIGRFRTYTTQYSGSVNLFKSGATSILDYMVSPSTATTGRTKFRFNGMEDQPAGTFTWNTGTNPSGLNAASQLGKGYSYDRTILGVLSEVILYDTVLVGNDLKKVESYLAFKYGVTLRPTTSSNGRFSYQFSDTTSVWNGDISDESSPFVKYYNNVAAVIRDDAARLNNRQSHSTDVGSLLHMGVAGSALSPDGSLLGSLNDKEAVVFGCDTLTTNTKILAQGQCGDFSDRFDRVWFVHKITQGDRPIQMIVGAQDNSGYTFGKGDANVYSNYYTKLTPAYDVTLIVASSREDIMNGTYDMAIPMNYVNGEYQCNYTFDKTDTYITFGWKINPMGKGCLGNENAQFTGEKTFKWTDWTSTVNTISGSSAGTRYITVYDSLPGKAGDLGDSILVTKTVATYTNGVTAPAGYPRTISVPATGSLQLQRGGTNNGDVSLDVTFNNPVQPTFSISAFDSYNNSFEELEIVGHCAGSDYLPVLSYASKNPSYKIVGNKATVYKKGSVAPTNPDGTLNVTFQGGVTSFTIKYRLVTGTSSITRFINISPIKLRPVPPPPPINEDGLSFVKSASPIISTCEDPSYTLEIMNVNCATKTVQLIDTLPKYMEWVANAIAIGDSLSQALNDPVNNPKLKFTIIPGDTTLNRGGILIIDSLIVPGGAKTLLLNAKATFVDNAPGGDYANTAWITYQKIVNNVWQGMTSSHSYDKYKTTDPYTWLTAQKGIKAIPVTVTEEYSKGTYREKSTLTVTYTFENQNVDLENVFLDVYYNEGFSYDPASLSIQQIDGTATLLPVLTGNSSSSDLMFAGMADASKGFTLSNGKLQIKFTITTPSVVPLDASLNPADLDISYLLYSAEEDPCLAGALNSTANDKFIPYGQGRVYIISNKHVTNKMK
jgi:hypothetical protein